MRVDDDAEEWGKEGNRPQPAQDVKEVKPDFGLSGALADETNKVNGVTLVYQEPPEAAQTNKRWRLYTFKAGQEPQSILQAPLNYHVGCNNDCCLVSYF